MQIADEQEKQSFIFTLVLRICDSPKLSLTVMVSISLTQLWYTFIDGQGCQEMTFKQKF